jgi:3-oxoadipate enol-lactonase
MIQFATLNGAKFAYRVDGPENGPVVILSNSLMTRIEMWDGNMEALTDRFRVIRYDTRGHGRSEVTEGPYTIDLLASDLVALLDHLKVPKAHIVGLSLGGMIGQNVAANYPDRVLSLSLCDTATEIVPRSTWADRIQIAKEKGVEALAEGTLSRWMVDSFRQSHPEEVDRIRQIILGTPAEGFMGCAGAIRDMNQTLLVLKIKAPTLVLVGAQDASTTVDNAIVLHRLILGSQLVVIDEAAHLSNIDQREKFNQTLRAFLDQQTK